LDKNLIFALEQIQINMSTTSIFKKITLVIFLSMLYFTVSAANKSIIFRIRLDSEINTLAQKKVILGLEKAHDRKADFIILDLDTYGGAVDAADSIRSAILRCDIPVVAYINMQAASAGALISIACDSIYMKTGSSIGAATVVSTTGSVMPDKYQSFMRGMMRSTAEANGRNPKIAEAMVDTAHVLSLTPSEAIKVGYCEGVCESVDEVAQNLTKGQPGGYRIESVQLSPSEKAVLFMMNPILQAIFLIMIIGGIYIEFKTPGIGVPIAVAILGAILYFSPLYIQSLAQNWEILLFIVGLILLGMELFVIPGFGVCGITGIISIVVSLTFAAVDNDLVFNGKGDFNYMAVLLPFGLVIISAFIAITGSIFLVHKLYPTKTFDYVALRQSLDEKDGFVGVKTGMDSLVGNEATVFNDLKPSGKVMVNGRVYEATLTFGYAAKGESVRIVKAEQGRLYCEKIS
jgi:membrane-bound serine protease (ClpP class)